MIRGILTSHGLAALVALSGCATLSQLAFVEPEVDLLEVQVMGLGLSGGTLNLVLDVYNPNTYDINSGRLSLALALDETPFGEIGLDRALSLPNGEHTSVELPLRFSWQGVGAGARALLDTGSVPYALRGTMWVDLPMGERAVSVGRGGTVTMRQILGGQQ